MGGLKIREALNKSILDFSEQSAPDVNSGLPTPNQSLTFLIRVRVILGSQKL
jgi:hypothetical protein